MLSRVLLTIFGPLLRWLAGPDDPDESGIHSDQTGLFK